MHADKFQFTAAVAAAAAATTAAAATSAANTEKFVADYLSLDIYMGYQQESESGDSPGTRGGPLSRFPPNPAKKKGGRALILLFLDCIDTLPIGPVGLVLNCHCP
jgi:hypothetical protein